MQNKKGKIMIIYSRYGGGHRAPAEALTEGFKKWHKNYEVQMVDFADLIGGMVDLFFRKSFFFSISHAPIIHRTMAAVSNSDNILDYFTRLSTPFVFRRFSKQIKKFNPDLIVTTFPAANRMLGKFKKDHKFKLLTVVTDLLTVHKYWIAPETDKYLVAMPEMKTALQAHGVSEEKIETTGYPVRLDFFKKRNKTSLRKSLSLKPNKFTVLYLVGAVSEDFALKLSKKLDQEKNFQTIVVCGKNKSLQKKIKKLSKNNLVLGFVKNISDYIYASDVAIGKAGTNFIMESATLDKPIIITNYIEPQEHGNVEVVISKKWGSFEPTPDLIIKKLLQLKNKPRKINNKLQDSTKKATKTILKYLG